MEKERESVWNGAGIRPLNADISFDKQLLWYCFLISEEYI